MFGMKDVYRCWVEEGCVNLVCGEELIVYAAVLEGSTLWSRQFPPIRCVYFIKTGTFRYQNRFVPDSLRLID